MQPFHNACLYRMIEWKMYVPLDLNRINGEWLMNDSYCLATKASLILIFRSCSTRL